ncbi:MAG: hypothetical protein K6F84_02325, partial [Lachnospiraceae bacterium]|nr:hypothetical protein [Lachnospiraceae bacterium]
MRGRKKIKQRLLSFLLTFSMIAVCMPSAVRADEPQNESSNGVIREYFFGADPGDQCDVVLYANGNQLSKTGENTWEIDTQAPGEYRFELVFTYENEVCQPFVLMRDMEGWEDIISLTKDTEFDRGEKSVKYYFDFMPPGNEIEMMVWADTGKYEYDNFGPDSDEQLCELTWDGSGEVFVLTNCRYASWRNNIKAGIKDDYIRVQMISRDQGNEDFEICYDPRYNEETRQDDYEWVHSLSEFKAGLQIQGLEYSPENGDGVFKIYKSLDRRIKVRFPNNSNNNNREPGYRLFDRQGIEYYLVTETSEGDELVRLDCERDLQFASETADRIYMKMTEKEKKIYGLRIRNESNGTDETQKAQDCLEAYEDGYIYELVNTSDFYCIEPVDYEMPFGGEFMVEFEESDGVGIYRIGEDGQKYPVENRKAYTFDSTEETFETVKILFSKMPYSIDLRFTDGRPDSDGMKDVNASYRQEENGNVIYEYTPDSYSGFYIKAYWSRDQYDMEKTEPDRENGEYAYFTRINAEPQVGSVTVTCDGNVITTAEYRNEKKYILKDEATFKVSVHLEGEDCYVRTLRLDGRDLDPKRELMEMEDGTLTYEWTVSEADDHRNIEIELDQEHFDGGEEARPDDFDGFISDISGEKFAYCFHDRDS